MSQASRPTIEPKRCDTDRVRSTEATQLVAVEVCRQAQTEAGRLTCRWSSGCCNSCKLTGRTASADSLRPGRRYPLMVSTGSCRHGRVDGRDGGHGRPTETGIRSPAHSTPPCTDAGCASPTGRSIPGFHPWPVAARIEVLALPRRPPDARLGAAVETRTQRPQLRINEFGRQRSLQRRRPTTHPATKLIHPANRAPLPRPPPRHRSEPSTPSTNAPKEPAPAEAQPNKDAAFHPARPCATVSLAGCRPPARRPPQQTTSGGKRS